MNSVTSTSSSSQLSLVSFRESITKVEQGLLRAISDGLIQSTLNECTVKHYFTPIDGNFGCYTYAREMTIPKDTVIVGKLHRHQHLNIISKGRVEVITEHGPKSYEAPCTFVSEVGTKRAVYAKEDTIWTTIHVVSYGSEADLDKIEAEVIAPSYDDLNLISTVKDFNMTLNNTNASEGGAA